MIRQNNHCRRTNETAVRLQRVEIQRDVAHSRRQNSTRGTAWKIGIKAVAGLHATTVFVNQFLNGDPCGCKMHTGFIDTTGD